MILSRKSHGQPAESFPDTPRSGPLRLLTRLYLLERNSRPQRTRISTIFSLRSALRTHTTLTQARLWYDERRDNQAAAWSGTSAAPVCIRIGKKGRVPDGEG